MDTYENGVDVRPNFQTILIAFIKYQNRWKKKKTNKKIMKTSSNINIEFTASNVCVNYFLKWVWT